MHFELISSNQAKMAQEKTDVLVLLLPSDTKSYAALPASIQDAIAFALKSGDLSHDESGICTVYRPSDISARYLVLASLGKEQKSHAFASLQKSLASAIKPLRDKKIQTLSIAIQPVLDALCNEEDATLTQYEALSSLVQAAENALYTYSHTKPSAKASPIQKLRFVCDLDKNKLKNLQADFDKAYGLALGIATAREWGNRPANHATPEHLGKAAKDIAKACPTMSCKILDRKAIEKLGMGAFLAVTQGSAQEPQFIVLEYKGGAKSQAPIALVGKGVTFDTGGISIKPAPQMDEMKFDMCGAASVLGTFEALTRLTPSINVIGLIPACENMPSGTAIKPGDVVTSMSGQTIEILNTDAEGRLILCDALTYAAQYKPSAVIDIATLTGACVIALGGVRAGLFSNDDALAVELTLAGERAGDPCWRMPLDAEYAKGLKSNFADMANVAGREAGAVTAAKFLEKFVKDLAWAHLDIAGVAWKSGADKGATGRPVALLTEFLLSQNKAV